MSVVGTLLLQIGEVGQKLVQKRKSEQFFFQLSAEESGMTDPVSDEAKGGEELLEGNKNGAKPKASHDDSGKGIRYL